MGVGKEDTGAIAGSGWSAAELHSTLGAVARAVDDLVIELDTVGLTQQLRNSPSCDLRALDRSLPHYPLEELLLACEAYATVTGPAALATDSLTEVREEAQRLLQMLQALAGAGRSRRRLPGMGFTATGTQNVFLRSAFSDPQVQDALSALIETLSPLAAINGGNLPKRGWALRIGPRYIIPVVVLGGAIALVVLLIGSFAFANREAGILPNGLGIPGLSRGANASATATAQNNPGAPTPPIASSPSAAATVPISQPTATTAPSSSGSPNITLSKSALSVCPGSPDSFTITYSGGQSITWTASWSDHTNITLSPSSGSLQSGAPVTVTVDALTDTAGAGTITIIPGGGASPRTLTYDATNC